MLPAQPNQSLIDGLALLQVLAAGSEPQGVRELARRMDMEPTRTHRLLKTLAHLGIAEQTPDRRYRSGPGMHVMSAMSLQASGLIRRAIEPLEALHRFGHIVALGVLWRRETCYLYHATPGMSAAGALGRAGLYPATQSGIGMALLAEHEAAQVRALYAEADSIPGFPSVTALQRELDRIRRHRYAYVAMRNGTVHTLAVAVGHPGYAAIALSGAIEPAQIQTLSDALCEAAEQINEPATEKK